MNRREALYLLGMGFAGATLPSRADAEVAAAREYYAGRTIRVLVPSAAGGIGDRTYRHFIDTFQSLVPETRFRVENNDRAGGRIWALELWRARPDGLTIGFPRNNLFYDSILDPEGQGLRFPEFTFLGSFGMAHKVFVLSNQTGLDGIDAVFASNRPVLNAANSAVSSHYYEALMMNALAGTHLRPIPGYGGATREMAVITGEVDCQIGTLESVRQILDAEAGDIVFRLSSRPLPAGYPQVPTLRERLIDPGNAWAVDMIDAIAALGRPVAGPPGMDPEATRHLRALFRAVAYDPAYQAEALARNGNVIDPTPADEIDALLQGTLTRGAALRDDLLAVLACGQARADSMTATCG